MKAYLTTNTTGHIEKEICEFKIITIDFKNSHAVNLEDGSIFQVSEDGGLLFYESDDGTGFNYAEDDISKLEQAGDDDLIHFLEDFVIEEICEEDQGREDNDSYDIIIDDQETVINLDIKKDTKLIKTLLKSNNEIVAVNYKELF